MQVLFFGILKDIAGRAGEGLELPDGATVADLLRHYEARIPKLRELLPSVALSVNQHYAGPGTVLGANDEVALLPPVSGGADEAMGSIGRTAIVRSPIDTAKVLAEIKRPEDGAAIVFEGIVRDNTRGRQTLYLEYEAYEEMALKQMEDLAAEALAQFKVREVAIVHRLGRLEIGETSVLIVVASAHRGAAYEASRWLIDTLKRKVPIWKKEYFVHGAVWADGEPFPEDIPRAQGSPSGQAASK
ncbi:MAG TPA: molybdenum cofactor biosynthesis protein MoaE [Terriglobales bacterium]|nr:molybdenum cofactor biosynthesis protein MoaE [Terriglobales bacterium]